MRFRLIRSSGVQAKAIRILLAKLMDRINASSTASSTIIIGQPGELVARLYREKYPYCMVEQEFAHAG
jgi:uncharacterized membrane protein YjjB (DUF3815 family)